MHYRGFWIVHDDIRCARPKTIVERATGWHLLQRFGLIPWRAHPYVALLIGRWRSVPSKADVNPMCASGYPPRLDPITLPFFVPPRVPGAPLLAAQPVVPEKPR
jgi:hypothetical protein